MISNLAGATCDDDPALSTTAAALDAVKLDDGKISGARFFNPSMWELRRVHIRDILKPLKPRSILELGCGEGKLLGFLSNDPRICKLSGVDLLRDRLEYAALMLEPKPLDYDVGMLRESPLTIDLYLGSLLDLDARCVASHEAVICTEVIEHLQLHQLERFSEVLFGELESNVIVVSTPNAEFNVYFPQLKYGSVGCSFRDLDHKFEWTRAEFEDWGNTAAKKYGYEVEYSGIGILVGNKYDASIGYCTQVAKFTRLQKIPVRTQVDEVNSNVYELVKSITFPFYDCSAVSEADIRAEILKVVQGFRKRDMLTWDESNGDYYLSVELVWNNSYKIRQMCGGDELKLTASLATWKASDLSQEPHVFMEQDGLLRFGSSLFVEEIEQTPEDGESDVSSGYYQQEEEDEDY